MSLTHHFPQAADAINGWLMKSGFPNDEQSSVRLALELGSKPVTDTNLDAAWKAVQVKPAPSDDVNITGLDLNSVSSLALVRMLQAKVANVPNGVPKGQLKTSLDTFSRVAMPWLFFEGR
jgi:hypothetical protein